MTDELKPCHCKRKPCIHRACLNNETYQRFAVVCSCGMNTDYWESEKDAVGKWNNRPIEDDMIRLIQEIREGAESLVFPNHRESDGKTIVDLCNDAIALAKGGQ